jgi:hypothetical protein
MTNAGPGRRGQAAPMRRARLPIFAALALGVIATVLAIGALVLALRPAAPAAPAASAASAASDDCATMAWKAVPDGSALPSGWVMVSNRIFVDTLTTTVAGPAPSGTTQRPAVYTGITCYGSNAALALRRAHEGALAAGGSDGAFATVGDESYFVENADAAGIALSCRRGVAVVDLSAASSTDHAALETIARAIDAAVTRAAGIPADASPLPQPSRAPRPSAAVAPQPTPAPSATATPLPPSHEAADLEKVLPTKVGTTAMAIQSVLGTTALAGGGTASQSLSKALQGFGKTPADLQIAGAYDPTGALDLRLFAYRVNGVDVTDLGRALIESQMSNTAANVTSSQVTIGGHPVTKLTYSQGAPVYYYPLNGIMYAIQSSDETLAGSVLGQLK